MVSFHPRLLCLIPLARIARHSLDLIFAALTRAAIGFLSPIAIYQILHYVETNGEGSMVNPW